MYLIHLPKGFLEGIYMSETSISLPIRQQTLARIHRGTAVVLEQGVRDLQGRWPGHHWVEGDRRTVFSRRTGPLWPSAGAAMGRMAREYAGGDSRGPGWRELAGTLGQLQAGRQAGSGMARSRARARLNWVSQGQRCGRCRVRRRAERVSRPARAKNRRRRVLMVTTCSPRPIHAVQRARLSAITCTVSQAALAAKRPDGRWLNPTPCLRSRMAFSISAWRR